MNQHQGDLVLSPEVLQLVRGDRKIKTRLALELRVDNNQINDWLDENSPHSKLTNIRSINILQQETKIPPNKILVLVGSPPCTNFSKETKRYPILSE